MRTPGRLRFPLLFCLSCFLLVPAVLHAETSLLVKQENGSDPSHGVLELLAPEEMEKVAAGGLLRTPVGAGIEVKECTAGIVLWDEDGLSRNIRSLSFREAIRN